MTFCPHFSLHAMPPLSVSFSSSLSSDTLSHQPRALPDPRLRSTESVQTTVTFTTCNPTQVTGERNVNKMLILVGHVVKLCQHLYTPDSSKQYEKPDPRAHPTKGLGLQETS